MKKLFEFDITKDSVAKILLCICLPLVITYAVSCFTTSALNLLYSRLAKSVFAVTALIGTATSSVTMIVNGVISSAWIKTAPYYKNNAHGDKAFFANSVYAVLITDFVLVTLCLVLKKYIFGLFNIPSEMYADVNVYYTVTLCTHFITALSTLIITCVNGVGTVLDILTVNIIGSCGTLFTAAVLLYVFNLGLVGAALAAPLCSLFTVIYGIFLLKRKCPYIITVPQKSLPDFKMISGILKIGFIMAAQCLLCQIGDICISLQTNRLLTLDYISVLSVTIPIAGVLSSFSAAVTAFVPINYSLGSSKRLKRFVNTVLILAVGYGVFCFLFNSLLGERYYSALFENPETAAMGAEYWRLSGIGNIFVSVIYVLRYFFDCIGRNRTAFVTGIFQLSGALLSAYVLIPVFGNIARSAERIFSFGLPAVYLLTVYFITYKKIYSEK